MTRIRRFAPSLIVLMLFAGCGGKQSAAGRASALQAFQQGSEAFRQRNYRDAVDQLTVAIDAGRLNPDTYTQAAINRAVANAALGNFEAANSDLDRLANAPDQSLVWAARAFVLSKQGKKDQAAAALRKAKQLNPSVQAFN